MFLLSLSISSCFPLPVHHEQPEFSIQPALDALIGSRKEVVVNKLGKPQQSFTSNNSTYFVYAGDGDDYYLWLLIWMPFGIDKIEKQYCVLLEFSDADILNQYQIGYAQDYYHLPEDWCASYTRKQGVEPPSHEELLSKADVGDVSAQWELYKRSKSNGEPAFEWLCAAADQGYYKAQWELGYLHYYGVHGVHKDRVLSFVWYSLVEVGGHNTGDVERIREELKPEQLAMADELIANWGPGLCAKELFGVDPNNGN